MVFIVLYVCLQVHTYTYIETFRRHNRSINGTREGTYVNFDTPSGNGLGKEEFGVRFCFIPLRKGVYIYIHRVSYISKGVYGVEVWRVK